MIIEWIKDYKTVFWYISGLSIITSVVTLILIPWLIVRIPSNYFSDRKRIRKLWAEHHPLIRAALVSVKNLFGYFCIVAGIIMLVLPGQGVLTILLGIIFIDIPGKYRFERWIVERPKILRSINRLRIRAKRDPLII
jgi:uncharacterized membrane protein SpoIIM required for sporulation